MSIEFIGFENLPNTYIKEVAIYDYSETEMEIRTTVCIKDLPDGSIWFDTSELLAQFLKISVYYSTSREDSSEINSGNLDITTLQGIDSKSVKEPKMSEDNLIFEYSFSKIINKDTAHLSVYAFCYISKDQILENLGITVKKSYLGPIKAEKVIDGSALIDNAYVFMRENGEYWSGPVHQKDDGKYMIGSYHTDTPHESLRRMVVKNIKLKDLRSSSQSTERKSRDATNFISDLQVSYNPNTDVNALFMLNIKSLLIQNTKYGSFLEKATDSVIDQILQNFNIKLMTIERHRIQPHKQSGRLRSKAIKAKKTFSRKSIVKTYDQGGLIRNMTRLERRGVFDIVESELRSSASEKTRKRNEIFIEQLGDYKKISKISELFFNYGQGIRTFQFNDYELTDRTPGVYQYKMSLSFIDPINRFLRDLISSMKIDVSNIKRYVGYISRGSDISETPIDYKAICENYVTNYSYLYDLSNRNKQIMLAKNLNLLAPTAVSLESSKKFQKEYMDLYAEFIRFLDYDPEISTNRNTNVSIKSKDSLTARILIEKVFDKIVQPSLNKYGLGYMKSKQTDSLSMFSRIELQQRAEEETTSNYVEPPNFNSPDLPEDVNKGIRDISTNSTAHFGPVLAKDAGTSLSLKFENKAKFPKLNKFFNKAFAKTKDTSGITVTEPEIPQNIPPEDTGETFVDASKIIGSGQSFVDYNEVVDGYNIIDKEMSSTTKIDNTFGGFKNNRTFEVTLANTKKLTGAEAAALPNQLKAVIGGTTSATRESFVSSQTDLLANPSTKNYYEVKNFSVQSLVYIDEFMSDSNGNILLNKPVFKLMSSDNMNSLNKPVVCFLQAYTNNKFNIVEENKTSVLDSVFVLTDKDITVLPDRATNRQQSNYTIQDLTYEVMRSEIVVQTNQKVTVKINNSDDNTEAPVSPRLGTNINLFGNY